MKGFIYISAILLSTFVFAATSSAQTNTTPDASGKQEKDRPVKITNRPSAGPGNCSESYGLARLKATFDKSAKITNVITVISSRCTSFDSNAVDAAKRIKFKPAIKNGEPVTVVLTIEYTYRTS